MVFCSVEGGKQYSAWNRQDAREVHLQLLAVMYSVLRQVPGGYFVRHQDGEFKYIVVFSKPEVRTGTPHQSMWGVTVGSFFGPRARTRLIDSDLPSGYIGSGGLLVVQACLAKASISLHVRTLLCVQAALHWCLAVQECALYTEWPATALKYWATERDSRDHVLFRGPRLKMGVCEGSPASIMPDHMGRADYHGASINQAARIMDAGARYPHMCGLWVFSG